MKKIILILFFLLALNPLVFAQKIINLTNKKITKKQIQIIENQAFSLIEKYTKILNFLGNPLNIQPDSNYIKLVADLFLIENKEKRIIYSDIFLCCFSPCEHTIEDYHRYITLWYQEGIEFELKKIKLLKIQLSQDNILAEFYVKRKFIVPSKNYKITPKLLFKIQSLNSEIAENELFTNPKISEIDKYQSKKVLRKLARWEKNILNPKR